MRRAWLRKTRTRTVIIHMRNDTPSVRGVLSGTFVDGLELRFAEMLKSGEKTPPTAMAGEVFVPREQIALVQTDDGRLALTAHAGD